MREKAMNNGMRNGNSVRGATLLELLVAIFISSVTLSSMMLTITQLARYASDQKIRLLTQLQAQSIIDMMTPELRMIGNGVPFHQANFLIGAENLSDPTVTEPIVVASSTATQIRFRINETGDTYILSSAFNPSMGTSIQLVTAAGIKANDRIYITNSVVDLDDGLAGVVSSVAGNTVTIAGGAIYPDAANFPMGSILEIVPNVTYNSPTDWSGITRDAGDGEVLLAPNSTMSITYLNQAGTAITLPLTATPTDPYPANDIQNVRSLRITVQVRSTKTLLSTGALYTATATQSVAVRNFNYFY